MDQNNSTKESKLRYEGDLLQETKRDVGMCHLSSQLNAISKISGLLQSIL